MEPTLSAVVVPVPEAEPRVGALRPDLDPAAALGVPVHVMITFSFLPPARIDDEFLAGSWSTVAELPLTGG